MKRKIVESEKRHNVLILRIKENKIYQNVLDDLRGQLKELTHENIETNVILNFSQVNVINSSGLGVLIMLADEMKKSKRRLIVTELKPLLKELFDRMKLETIFDIFETDEKAIQNLEG